MTELVARVLLKADGSGLVGQVRQGATAMQELGSATVKAGADAKAMAAGTAEASGQIRAAVESVKSATVATHDYQRQLAKLRAEVDPLGEAQRELARAMDIANTAFQRGDLNADQYAAAVKRAEAESRRHTATSERHAFATRNLGQQFGDLGLKHSGRHFAGTCVRAAGRADRLCAVGDAGKGRRCRCLPHRTMGLLTVGAAAIAPFVEELFATGQAADDAKRATIEDAYGRPMTSAHANRGERRYLCYVSRPIVGQSEEQWRLPAGDLDAPVTTAVLTLLRDPVRLAGEFGDARANTRLAPLCADWADRLQQPAALRAALQQVGAAVIVGTDRVTVTLGARELTTLLRVDGLRTAADQRIELHIETSLKRRGHELRLIYAVPEANSAMRDDRLVQLMASGHAAYDQLLAGEGLPGTTQRSHLVRLARLRFLAPDIVTAIVHGRQPVELTTRTLLRSAKLPLAWADQRKMLGFG